MSSRLADPVPAPRSAPLPSTRTKRTSGSVRGEALPPHESARLLSDIGPQKLGAREPFLHAASSACRCSPSSPRSPAASSSATGTITETVGDVRTSRDAAREPPVRRPRATRPASSGGWSSQPLQQPSNAAATGPILPPRPSRPRLRLERFHARFTSSFPGIGRGRFRDSDTQ